MTTLVNPWFGMQPDKNHPGPYWGARAIYRVLENMNRQGRRVTRVTTFKIELLPDRQQMLRGTDEERAALERWINRTGLPLLDNRCNEEKLHPDEPPRAIVIQRDGYEIVGDLKSTRSEYLYIGAWPICILVGGKPVVGSAPPSKAEPASPASPAYRVTNLASLKRIPVGTRLRLVENARGPVDNKLRIVAAVNTTGIEFSGPDLAEGKTSHLPFPRAASLRIDRDPDGFAILLSDEATVGARYVYDPGEE